MGENAAWDLPPGLALAWGVEPARTRGPQPSHTIDDVVRAAAELADQHGVAGLSMPKVAAALGLTQNALYRYVASKEELLVLLWDAALPTPPTLPHSQWREAVSQWTHALIDGYLARPWLLDLPIRSAPRTPRVLRWTEAALAVLAETGLPAHDQLRLATLLDGYASSTARLNRDLSEGEESGTQSHDVLEFLAPRLNEGGFPRVASLLATGSYHDTHGMDEADIEFGLQRILDGIERLLEEQHKTR